MVGLLVAGCGGGGNEPGVASVSTLEHLPATVLVVEPANGGGGTALGGGGPSSGSSGGAPRRASRSQTGNPQKALKLSECMRANGVPNFPTPTGRA